MVIVFWKQTKKGHVMGEYAFSAPCIGSRMEGTICETIKWMCKTLLMVYVFLSEQPVLLLKLIVSYVIVTIPTVQAMLGGHL